jgi:hypothetical protein
MKQGVLGIVQQIRPPFIPLFTPLLVLWAATGQGCLLAGPKLQCWYSQQLNNDFLSITYKNPKKRTRSDIVNYF